MRLIDAYALIVVIEQMMKHQIDADDICEMIQNFPPIEPERKKGKWIPCSERLPKEKDTGILKKLGIEKRSEDVLATVEVKGGRMTVTACTYDGKWDWNMKYAFPDYKVIAWMPFPEPYTERQKGEKDGQIRRGDD